MEMQWIGHLGTGLVIAAYMPQIIHLTRNGCTAGISISAYLSWFLASILLLCYAISLKDSVFIFLQVYQLLATSLILLFSYKHRGQNCDLHGGECVHDNIT